MLKPIAYLLAACLLIAATADAKPRRLSDLGQMSWLGDSEAQTPNAMEFEMASGFDRETISFKQWHGEFNSIGKRRAGISTQNEFEASTLEQPMFRTRKAPVSMDARPSKMARTLNVDEVRENVISNRFRTTDLKTAEGRRFQDLVDEMSLRDIHRFQGQRNKRDDGIPVQDAGREAAPDQLSSEITGGNSISGNASSTRSVEEIAETGASDPSSPVVKTKKSERTASGLIKETTTTIRMK